MASVSFLSELPFSRDRLLFVVVVVADSSAAVTTLGLLHVQNPQNDSWL